MKTKLKKSALCRKIACVGLTAVMIATSVAGQVFAFSGGEREISAGDVQSVEFSNANGKVDLSEVRLSNLSKEVIENDVSTAIAGTTRPVIVSLEGESLLKRGLDNVAAREEIDREHKSFLKKLDKAGIGYKLRSDYYSALNGVAIDVKLSDLKAIKAIDGVSTVSVSSTYAQPKAVESSDGAQENYSNIYKNGIYDSSDYGEKHHRGAGTTVAILDTGLDYTHAAFSVYDKENNAKLDLSKIAIHRDDIRDKMSSGAFAATARSGATYRDVYISEKVPFAYDYADSDNDVYPSYSQHGTHVAGIVAGNDDHYDDKDGNRVDEPFLGVAPDAQLIICKVFTDDLEDDSIGGAESIDILAALDDCVKLGVDIINMSLGTSCGFSSQSLGLGERDEEGWLMQKTYNDIREAGITLMVAASNDFSAGYGSAFGTNLASNPDSGTIGSPSTFSGAMSVASINGQRSSYLIANANVSSDGSYTGGTPVYFEESRNEDSDSYDFVADMLEGLDDTKPHQFKYVAVSGIGDAADYTSTVRRELQNLDSNGNKQGKTIALVRRGGINFKDKVKTARDNGADGVIVYNNVSGMIRMSLADLKEHIPAVSISMESGQALLRDENGRRRTTGTIIIRKGTASGPFMNDYSSWGTTPDLQLKPDITSHGGEITSTVSGGYQEMSGTSMACPNLAGFTALVKGYLREENPSLDAFALTKLTNNIIMSTATTVYDQNSLPYSPRKQGAGLATLKNVFETKAYLYTLDADKNDSGVDVSKIMCEDGRPKAELGEDKDKKGVYNITFYVKNFGESPLKFRTNSILMTETLGVDGKSVAEKAYILDDETTLWKVGGQTVAEGGEFTVGAGEVKEIEATLKLSAAEKKYLDDSFKNGMFVEGFLQLIGENGQCNLNFPFMGFYGDWKAAPMLDLTAFDVAQDAKDTSLKEEERRQPSVWATQGYGYYYNERYLLPLGSFVYLQDEAKEHTADYVYPDEEYVAVSGFNEYNGEGESGNYLTITGIKSLYAGLLRNAEIVTYTLTNVDTGEIIPDDSGNNIREIYRVNKAHSSGGSSVPAQVLLELRTNELGLRGNGKYRLDFDFYFDYEDYANGSGTDDKFTMNFYVDYEAPVLVDSRIRFQDRKTEDNRDTQSVYLDLDVYDNHYPQSVMLCYAEDGEFSERNAIKLATQYITPIINPQKNSVNTVSLDITEIYETYKKNFFVELSDYALNSNVYYLNMEHSLTEGVCPADYKVTLNGKEITETVKIEKNSAVKLGIEGLNGANISNFTWESNRPTVASVKNGEIFGANVGFTTITVRGGAQSMPVNIPVEVIDSNRTLKIPSVSFGTMLNYNDVPVKASGIVRVNPAQQIQLKLEADPWYYPLDTLEFEYTSSNPEYVEVDRNTGAVSILYEGDDAPMVTVTATAKGYPTCSATVAFMITDPYTITNGTLTRYRGWGGKLDNNGVLVIPAKKAIMSIGDEAFKECENLDTVVIPKAVTQIGENAFQDCKTLKKICFVSTDKMDVADSDLSMVHRYAFNGCTALETVDFTNCKVITLDRNVFTGCTSLKEIIKWEAIGTMSPQTFMGCTALKSAKLTDLHIAGAQVFAGCTGLETVEIGSGTALGAGMFMGCTALKEVEINCNTVPANAFNGCTALTKVTLGSDLISIGSRAFYGCSRLSTFTLNGHSVESVGSYAFANCSALPNLYAETNFRPEIGENAFQHVVSMDRPVITDGKLEYAPRRIDASFSFDGITEIAPYAFNGSLLSGVDSFDLSGVAEIGRGAFYGLRGLTSVTLSDSLTEIPAYAFRGCTDLASVTIPAGVKSIGSAAFANCSSLATLNFEGGNDSALTSIGTQAFSGCAITALTLPDGVETIGGEAFSQCPSLTEAHISSVKRMGQGVFAYCDALVTATFGANAETTGRYTFYNNYQTSTQTNPVMRSSLTNVELSDKITYIDVGAFAYCNRLTSIDLKSVTEIDMEAFYRCTALTRVTGLERIKEIGGSAFAFCSSLTSVNLSGADSVYYQAFLETRALGTVTFGSELKVIGDEAFAYSALEKVNIPASCTLVGVSAFRGCDGLTEIKVAADSKSYFNDEAGALYSYVNGSADSFALNVYPSGKVADGKTVTVIDGTIAIGEFAFAEVPETALTKVVLPYTLKTIGSYAFAGSGITDYQFESIQAPTLLERVSIINGVPQRIVPSGNYSSNSFYYNNFNYNLAGFVSLTPGAAASAESPLRISYPVNGRGYDNYLYANYFGTQVKLDERPEDEARTLKGILENMPEATVVGGWNKNNTDKASVTAFSEEVKSAHAIYNSLKTDVQLDYVGRDNIDKLFAVESALKDVKQEFGIIVRARVVAVDASSSHRSEYTAGEHFSLNGLKLLITYDDYSQEVIDAATGFELEERFAERALMSSDSAVTLQGFGDYAGRSISIRVSVKEGSSTENGGTNGNGGIGTLGLTLIIVGAVVLVVAAAAVTVIVLMKKGIIFKYRRNSKKEDAEDAENAESAENSEDAENGGNEDKQNGGNVSEESENTVNAEGGEDKPDGGEQTDD